MGLWKDSIGNLAIELLLESYHKKEYQLIWCQFLHVIMAMVSIPCGILLKSTIMTINLQGELPDYIPPKVIKQDNHITEYLLHNTLWTLYFLWS